VTRDMSKSIRAFIAVELPETVLAAIDGVQERLAAHGFSVRWVKTENIHLTLKFLGEVDEDEVDGIAAVLIEAVNGFAPLRLAAAGVGVFPSVKRARVVWIGISGQIPELSALQCAIEDRLARIGYPHEKRPFSGHLTLGRVKGPIAASRLTKAMGAFHDFASETFEVDRVVLFKSDLRPSGALYTKLRQVTLSGQ
jgi:RNA 2',3'-cyclic 3'-phosphodiesterase